jgi:fatty acid desaturase
VSEAHAWTRVLAHYRQPSDGRSIVEIGITFVPLVLLWLLIWAALDLSYWLSLLLAVPTAGFLVRLFMIQHDCSHGAFFSHRQANDWIGRVIGVLTMTPYDLWRRTHAIHHATSGNLDRRGIGDIDTLTNTWRDHAGDGFATVSTAIPSSCSALAPPISSFCSTGFRSDRCARAGNPGRAPWPPMPRLWRWLRP